MAPNRRKTTIEECRRVTAHEAAHIGAATVEKPVAGSSAQRLWAKCPQCEKAVRFLFLPPGSQVWACRSCHQLTTQKRQERGTRAGFARWLTPQRWAELGAQHPAQRAHMEESARDFRQNVAPLDWDKADQTRRAGLLITYGTEARVRFAHDFALTGWSGDFETRGAEVAREVYADLWREWKANNRTPKGQR